MKKLLRASDKILLGLAFLGDLGIEIYTRGHGFGRKKSWSEALNIKNSTFRAELNRFLQTGEIVKIVDKAGRPCYKLSSSGVRRIERFFPLFRLSRKPWDEKWRVVVFDITEKERFLRDSLRDKLISLGFGKLQESVYITPLDVLVDLQDFLNDKGLYGKTLVFEAREILGINSRIIANSVWMLDKINKEYSDLISEAEEQDGQVRQGKEKEMKERYYQLLLKDPLLPKELLPSDWLGEKARQIILSF